MGKPTILPGTLQSSLVVYAPLQECPTICEATEADTYFEYDLDGGELWNAHISSVIKGGYAPTMHVCPPSGRQFVAERIFLLLANLHSCP